MRKSCLDPCCQRAIRPPQSSSARPRSTPWIACTDHHNSSAAAHEIATASAAVTPPRCAGLDWGIYDVTTFLLQSVKQVAHFHGSPHRFGALCLLRFQARSLVSRAPALVGGAAVRQKQGPTQVDCKNSLGLVRVWGGWCEQGGTLVVSSSMSRLFWLMCGVAV